jgi:hypothetical protein
MVTHVHPGRRTDVTISTLGERPDLIDRLYDVRDGQPEFLSCDPLANTLFHRIGEEFGEYCVVATTEDGTVAGRGRAVPFAFGGPGRSDLPDGGLGRMVVWAFRDRQEYRRTNVAGLVDVTVTAAYTGKGLTQRILAALCLTARNCGAETLIAPVRPSNKYLQPELSMAEYVRRMRADGLPLDPWLRVHVRAGGTILGVAPASRTIVGSLAQWRRWTDLPFDRTGPVLVPYALVPVHCDFEHDYAVYVEPSVWVRHELSIGD